MRHRTRDDDDDAAAAGTHWLVLRNHPQVRYEPIGRDPHDGERFECTACGAVVVVPRSWLASWASARLAEEVDGLLTRALLLRAHSQRRVVVIEGRGDGDDDGGKGGSRHAPH